MFFHIICVILSPVSGKNMEGGESHLKVSHCLKGRRKERGKRERNGGEKKMDYKLAIRAVAVKEKKRPALSSSGPLVKKSRYG